MNKLIHALFATLWLAVAIEGAAAADPAPAADPVARVNAGIAAEPAPLVVANRQIVLFRATLLGRTPTDRAEGAELRIEQALDRGVEGNVTTSAIPQGIAIELDGAAVFAITPEDVDDLAGETLQSNVDNAARMLAQAVRETNERRDMPRMLRAIGLTALSTALFAGFIYGLIFTFGKLIDWLSALYRARARDMKIKGVIAIRPSQFLQFLRKLVIAIGWLIALTVLHVWLSFVLSLFPYTRPWGEQLGHLLLQLALSMLHSTLHALPGLVTVVFILLIARFISNLVSGFFERIKAQHIRIGWLDEDTAVPTQRIAVAVIWLFAVAMAYPYLPAANTDAFKGLTVLLGLMVSIGASGVMGQLASGMILLYTRALRPGDYVKIGDAAEGTVTEMGMLTTRILTGTGDEIVLPNTLIVTSVTRNFSRDAGAKRAFALHVTATIGYSTPWRQVHAMLIEAAVRTKGVLAEPAPYVIQTALSDFYVEYKLVAYAGPEAPAQRALAISHLNSNVLDVFNEYGVQIMSPHYMADPPQPQVVPAAQWFTAPAQSPEQLPEQSTEQTQKK